MRRWLLAILIAGATLTSTPPASAGVAAQCRQEAARPAGVKDLIRCVAPKFNISTAKALAIADRESRFHPGAYNSNTGACGVYQHLKKFWPERVARWYYGPRTVYRTSCFNGRTNVLVTLRMVRQGGWGPWGG